MGLTFDDGDLRQARRFNALLGWMPRFRASGRLAPAVLQALLRLGQLLPRRSAARAGLAVETRTVSAGGGRARIRILRPAVPPRAVHIDFHGGAWVLGNARFDDPVTERIAAECGVAVVSVDVHLARDDRLDLCIADAVAAARWVAERGAEEFGCDRILLGGESSGAHLAALALLRLRDDGVAAERLAGAVFFYGGFDMGGTPSLRAAPADTLLVDGRSAFLNVRRLTASRGEAGRRAPDLSPLHADLAGLPPALFLVGGLDPVVDDSRFMAARWQAAGNAAELVEIAEAPHGFNRFPTRMADKTNAYVRAWIKDRLGPAA